MAGLCDHYVSGFVPRELFGGVVFEVEEGYLSSTSTISKGYRKCAMSNTQVSKRICVLSRDQLSMEAAADLLAPEMLHVNLFRGMQLIEAIPMLPRHAEEPVKARYRGRK